MDIAEALTILRRTARWEIFADTDAGRAALIAAASKYRAAAA